MKEEEGKEDNGWDELIPDPMFAVMQEGSIAQGESGGQLTAI